MARKSSRKIQAPNRSRRKTKVTPKIRPYGFGGVMESALLEQADRVMPRVAARARRVQGASPSQVLAKTGRAGAAFVPYGEPNYAAKGVTKQTCMRMMSAVAADAAKRARKVKHRKKR